MGLFDEQQAVCQSNIITLVGLFLLESPRNCHDKILYRTLLLDPHACVGMRSEDAPISETCDTVLIVSQILLDCVQFAEIRKGAGRH